MFRKVTFISSFNFFQEEQAKRKKKRKRKERKWWIGPLGFVARS